MRQGHQSDSSEINLDLSIFGVVITPLKAGQWLLLMSGKWFIELGVLRERQGLGSLTNYRPQIIEDVYECLF